MSEPMPVDGKEDVFPRLIAFIEQRAAKGMETYGKPLQTFNGRRPLVDALEEALDLAVYLMQAVMEQEAREQRKVAPVPPPPVLPPDYVTGYTCEMCWEWFEGGWLSKWLHRRKWGHEPVYMASQRPRSDTERHTENVAKAEAWREQQDARDAAR